MVRNVRIIQNTSMLSVSSDVITRHQIAVYFIQWHLMSRMTLIYLSMALLTWDVIEWNILLSYDDFQILQRKQIYMKQIKDDSTFTSNGVTKKLKYIAHHFFAFEARDPHHSKFPGKRFTKHPYWVSSFKYVKILWHHLM